MSALATKAASGHPQPVPVPPISAAPISAAEKDAAEKNKITYKVTAKELEDMDKKAADKNLERPLKHHWSNFTFYLMASLSIILPLFFLSKSAQSGHHTRSFR